MPPKKKLKTSSEEEEIERRTASAVGFSSTELLATERSFLPADINEDLYTEIRNVILTKWRSKPGRYLTVAGAQRMVQKKYAAVAELAWRFLEHYGFINFGVSDSMNSRLQGMKDTNGAVIIIGAGLAGLAAARQLRMKGHRALVLEARGQIGGRVESDVLHTDDGDVIVEVGGSILTGINGNPLAILATQLDIPMHQIDEKTTLHGPDGSVVSSNLDRETESLYNTLLDKCGQSRDVLGKVANHISLGDALETVLKQEGSRCSEKQRQLIQWHFANMEFANACLLDTVSLQGWDQDDPYAFKGKHVFLAGGNGQLINALSKNLDILCNEVVKKISYSERRVDVETDDRVYQADAVLVTVPLGVLKRKTIVFEPPLTVRKSRAIHRLGFGVLNKIIMCFSECFWKSKGDVFGYVNGNEDERGLGFLFYSYEGISGGHVLAALVSGDAAESMDVGSNDSLYVDKVLQSLKAIFEDGDPDSKIDVPLPLGVCCTHWGRYPYTCGSYSSVKVGASGDDYDILAENIGKRVFFAGEATCREHPATMHGAFLSGLREAAYMTAALKTRVNNV